VASGAPKGTLDDAVTLRRCVRELAALSTLSAVWSGHELPQIADGLAGVLLRALPIDVVNVRLHGLAGNVVVEAARTPHGPIPADRFQQVTDALHGDWTHRGGTTTIANPFGDGLLRLIIAPLGYECGTLIAGSEDPDFPSQTDRLILGVACNQAAIVFQQRRSDQRLRRSELELADFFENATAGLHWVGPDGMILRANRAELALLGYSANEYVGRHIADFHVDREVIDDILRRLWAGEQVRDYEARMRCKDGSIRHVLIDSSVLWEDDRFIHTRCFTRDITERKHAEEIRKRAQETLEHQTERLGLLWEAASVLLVADDPDAMLRELLAKIGSHLGVDTYFNYVVADSGDALRLSSCQGVPADAVAGITRLDFGQAISGTVALRRQPLVVTYIQQSDEPMSQLVKSFGIRAYVCNPLLVGNRLLGTLSFASRSRDRFDTDEVTFMETICHYVTVAFERLRLLNALKQSDQRKDEFLATLAHELRNPLAPIRNAVKVLDLKGSPAPEARWGREVIGRQVEHLTRLIDDLLEISRITRNELELRKRCVTLEEVIAGALEASRPLIEASGHTLTVSMPPDPVYLDGDLVRLSQVVLNLLNNAAKYTEAGGRISLTAERNGDTATVRVKDTGVGIAADTLPLLFEMFYQVDRSRERSKGGLGIGLALVRRLVEAHGGTVEARSDGAGTGSEFIVRLPALAADTRQVNDPTQVGVPTVRGVRILVVDDNHDSADSLSAFLRLAGNEVYSAYDGIEALQTAEQHRPEVVLLDIGMPRLNGEDTCRRLRSKPWGAGLTMIALTGWGQEEDRRRTLDAGFDAHLIKPIDPADVMMLIEGRRHPPRE
jgi:PAS domain S-box-containing protein